MSLFEDLGLVKDPNVVSLQIGAPGGKQLERIAGIAKQATDNLMVSIIYPHIRGMT